MFRIGIDIGGTFTDCAVIDEYGKLVTSKSLSTHDDPAAGVMNVMSEVSAKLDMSTADLLSKTSHIVHGCTIALHNVWIERTGAKTGLITTKGFEDTIIIGRAMLKNAGLSEREMAHMSRLKKPPPIVERGLIVGVTERIDRDGNVIIPLDVNELSRALDYLVVDNGVKSIAVSFLWSFLNPSHEQIARDLISKKYPKLFVSATSDLMPVIGEYERTVTTVANCYLAPWQSQYLERLERRLRESGYNHPLLVMQGTGGLTSVEDASKKAVLTFDSGPVSGIVGSKFFGELYGEKNLICTDMGGTSFKVGLIYRNQEQIDNYPDIDQYTFRMPKVLVRSIGSGGGSIIWTDETGLLHVGPNSAGSEPGPACYDTGGIEPTTTDADLLLGYLDPDYFLGGRMHLNKNKAELAFSDLVKKSGSNPIEMSVGAFKIINSQMADLVRKSTIERGFDPRDFVLVSYGGAGPIHVPYYSSDIQPKATLVFSDATVFSALGMLMGHIKHTAETSVQKKTPLNKEDVVQIEQTYKRLEKMVLDAFVNEGVSSETVAITRMMTIRYEMQMHELTLELPRGPISEDWLRDAFKEFYEGTYGAGTTSPESRLQLVALRVSGTHRPFSPIFPKDTRQESDPSKAQTGVRQVYFDGLGFSTAKVYDSNRLRYGDVISGPAIVPRVGDTVVIPPDFSGSVDEFRNMWIRRDQ